MAAASKEHTGVHASKPITRVKITSALTRPQLYIGIIVVIILLYAASSLLSGNAINQLSGTQSFTIPTNGTVFFSFPGNSTKYALSLRSSSNSSATFYLTPLPALANPIEAVVLSPGVGANLSGDAQQIADVHLTLTSGSQSGATFSLSPLSKSLGIRVSSTVFVINPPSLFQRAPAGNLTTTTIGAATSITATATSSSSVTTTISSGTPTQQIMQKLNSTNIGALMANYKKLYKKDAACTSSLYNSTYLTQEGVSPTAPSDFQNVSQQTPTDLTWNTTKVGSGTYNITYSEVVPASLYSGPVLTVQFDLNLTLIVSQVFRGNFRGLNYSLINAAYQYQNSVGGLCGAYMPYIPH